MAVDNKVADATQNFLYAKLVDQVVTGTYINQMFLKGAKPWAGAQEEIPIKWQRNTQGGSFAGADILSTTIVDNTVKMTFDAKFYYQPSNLTMTDLALNETEMQRASLMDRQVQSDAADMMVGIATQLYSDGTGNSNKDFTGLAAAVDDGTSVTTYGNLSRSTYSSLDATKTATGGTLTLAKMFTMWDTLQQDQQQPSVILTDKPSRSYYEQLLLPNLRYASWAKMGVGASREGLVFREAVVMADSACTTGRMYFLNESTFQFKALKNWYKGTAIKYGLDEMEGEPTTVQPKGLGFFATDWIQPVNQMTVNKFVVLGGNLMCNNPRYNGVLTGITGI